MININKVITVIGLTSLFATSFSQTDKNEEYSLKIGGSYLIPKKDLRENFNLLKGLEISIEKYITPKSSIGLSYYSGYKWGKGEIQSRELEPKINANGVSIDYNHRINTSSRISPFFSIGLGYEKFNLGMNKQQKRIIEEINGETINLGIGTNIGLNKKKNKELYLEVEKEFFIPNSKTNNKYSNFKIDAGIKFNRYSKNKRYLNYKYNKESYD